MLSRVRLNSDWDSAYGKHLVALRDVWDHQKSAIDRALPLTVDDEPVDLLELLDQQPAPATSPSAPAAAAALQAGALRSVVTNPPTTASPPDEGLFTLPSTDPNIGR